MDPQTLSPQTPAAFRTPIPAVLPKGKHQKPIEKHQACPSWKLVGFGRNTAALPGSICTGRSCFGPRLAALLSSFAEPQSWPARARSLARCQEPVACKQRRACYQVNKPSTRTQVCWNAAHCSMSESLYPTENTLSLRRVERQGTRAAWALAVRTKLLNGCLTPVSLGFNSFLC